jgi:uncharacterized membrane protein YfcA
VPLMLLLGFPALTAIGTGQVLQVASAAAGYVGNMHYEQINLLFAAWLVGPSCWVSMRGIRLAHRLNGRASRAMVALLSVAPASRCSCG